MRVLVTGGAGFIGSHLVRRLAAEGHDVCCLMRSPRPRLGLVPGVRYIVGDLLQPASWEPALNGVAVVYHVAGATQVVRKEDFGRANAESTRLLAEACARQARPPVVVFTSSLAAAGPTTADRPITEEAPETPVSFYGRSKLRAEEHLRAVADRVPVTVVRPPGVFGPGDSLLMPLFRLVRWRFNVVPGRGLRVSWIYVADLVEALIRAAERGRRLHPGGRSQGIYFVGLDERPSFTEIGQICAEAQGLPLWFTVPVPPFVCRFQSRLHDLVARLTGRRFFLGSDKLSEALAGAWLCLSDKAKRELGFTCRTGLREGFRLTAEWYRAQGWL
jgi:nucleoside-diphosphate-sugar epimerase